MDIRIILIVACLIASGISFKDGLPKKSSYPLIAKDLYYEIRGDDERNYYEYTIKDKKGNTVEHNCVERMPPTISYISSNIIELRLHGGTYADLCRYYDIDNDILSESFWNPILTENGKIVYYTEDKLLVVQNIFSKDIFYKAYSFDMFLTGPPEDIRFLNNGDKLYIRYITPDSYIEKVEIVDLTE